MSPLRRERQTFRQRSRLRRHLSELEKLHESRLRELGALALEMRRSGGFDRERLWKEAAAIGAIEEQVELVRHGIEERVPLSRLEEIARS